MDPITVAINVAELGTKEALIQFRLLAAKLAEARAVKARSEQLVDGYSRMLEGLNLLYPGLSEATTTEPDADDSGTSKSVPEATRAAAELIAAVESHFKTVEVTDPVPLTGSVRTSTPVSSTKAVRDVLADLGYETRVTTRDVLAEIEKRDIKLDSDNPLTVVRKALAHGVDKGWINSADRDGRTKVYWIKTEADTSPDKDPGPAELAGPEQEADDDEKSSEANVVTGAFGSPHHQ